MQNHHLPDGFPIIDPKNSCQCTEELIKKLTKNRVSIIGVMGLLDNLKNRRIGLHTVNHPKLIGAKQSHGLIVFTFCPFCGVRLVPEENNNVETLHSQN